MQQTQSKKSVSLGTLFGIITIVLYASYFAGKSMVKPAPNAPQVQVEESEVKLQNIQLMKKLAKLERDYQIELEAKKSLGDHLNNLQQQNTELVRDLTLYQTIAGASSSNQKLHIKSFQLFKTEDIHTFRYLIVLAKQLSPEHYAQGAVKMTIMGRIGKKRIDLPVKYVDSSRNDGLAFKFRHFQELTGELTLPAGFIPDEVWFQVNPDKQWPHFQQHFAWRANTGA